MNQEKSRLYINFIKPALDKVISFITLVILLPFLLLIFLILTFTTKGKPLFIQKRPGLHGVLFNILKFRTMSDTVDKNGHFLTDIERITIFGKFLRWSSLDELPQLINVIKGEMSLVGPRPLLTEYLPLYNEFQKKRHNVMPGITGWAQLNGRDQISWSSKFELDVWYVENISFKLDLKILLLTITRFYNFNKSDSRQKQSMNKFKG